MYCSSGLGGSFVGFPKTRVVAFPQTFLGIPRKDDPCHNEGCSEQLLRIWVFLVIRYLTRHPWNSVLPKVVRKDSHTIISIGSNALNNLALYRDDAELYLQISQSTPKYFLFRKFFHFFFLCLIHFSNKYTKRNK